MLYYHSSSKTVQWNLWAYGDPVSRDTGSRVLQVCSQMAKKALNFLTRAFHRKPTIVIDTKWKWLFQFHIGTDFLCLLLLLRKEQRSSLANWPRWVTCGLWQFPRVLSGSRTQQRWTRSKTLNPGNATPQPLLPALLASAKNVTMPTDSARWAHAHQHAHPITHGLETRMETKPEQAMIMRHLNILRVVRSKIGTLLNYDGDGNWNAKKAIGLMSKTTTLQVHDAFLYISLQSLHN